MQIGVAYYPEHWPQERWGRDAAMMRQAGIDVVRIGEFAWSRLEPRRGRYETDWLERAIDVLAGEGLRVILCTPTAAPPSWLFHRHPPMMPQDREGKPWYPGSRRHVCLNNRPYRRYVLRIVREIAKNLGSKPEVFAWQVDNELGCHASGRCYCDDCEQAFREWLKRRYGTVERLNNLWGTAFWSQEFGDWHYIPAPRRTPAGTHPSLELDYQRFISATIRDFFDEQRDIIEEYAGGAKPVTTNGLGLSTDQVNQFSLGSVVDVAAYDNYPVATGNLDWTALQLDLTRSVQGGPFWVAEQQAGPSLIPTREGQPAPGQLGLWSYQAAARGAELICYFRWRTCRWGQEMHWYGMLEPDGRAGRRFEEISETIGRLKNKADLWEPATPAPTAAMVLDYDSHWALRADSMGTELDYRKQLCLLYSILRRKGIGVEVLAPSEEPAEDCRILVVPMPIIGRAEVSRAWEEFVAAGGQLLITAPAGYRNEYNAALSEAPPGPLSELLGLNVVEHDTSTAETANGIALNDDEFPAADLCTIVESRGAEVLGTYTERFYAGTPAVTRNELAEGAAYYVGTNSSPELYAQVLERMLTETEVRTSPWAGETLEVVPLQNGPEGATLTFVLNHSPEPCELELPEDTTVTDLLGEAKHSGTVPMGGFGVVLLQR